jgi:Xaa-Pro aminopeptidase
MCSQMYFSAWELSSIFIITAHRVLFVHTVGRFLRAELETCKMVTNNDLLLMDSGAQYIDGTTDVTRTFHTGTPTDYQVC